MADALPPALDRMLALWNGATDIDPADVYVAGCLLNGGSASFEPDAVMANIGDYRAAFPDLRWSVEEWFSAGDRYVLRMRCAGTHTGAPFTTELGAAKAAGERVEFAGIEVFEVKDDRIVDVWLGWDRAPLLVALGATF
jgi:predicted ester cyclase